MNETISPHGTSIPGYAEVADWPREPTRPITVRHIEILRDGGTVVLSLVGGADSDRRDVPFFFDRMVGRLCYGRDERAPEAAFITRGSAFEHELFSGLDEEADHGDRINSAGRDQLKRSLAKAYVHSGLP